MGDRAMRKLGNNRMRGTKLAGGVHAIDTEVRTLNQAIHIIEKHQRKARGAKTRRENMQEKGTSLKQEFGKAKSRNFLKAWHKKRKPKPKLPHPFRDLHPNEKALKVREMYDHGRGHWGYGEVAFRRLAVAFGVPIGVIAIWANAKGGGDD